MYPEFSIFYAYAMYLDSMIHIHLAMTIDEKKWIPQKIKHFIFWLMLLHLKNTWKGFY
jgi:hypothetical protein